jgi:uncharacterized protein YcfL
MRNAKGVVDRTSLRSRPTVSMRSPSKSALTVTYRLVWLDNSLTGVEATSELRTQCAVERFLLIAFALPDLISDELRVECSFCR